MPRWPISIETEAHMASPNSVRLEKSVADLDVLIPTPTRSIVEGVYTM